MQIMLWRKWLSKHWLSLSWAAVTQEERVSARAAASAGPRLNAEVEAGSLVRLRNQDTELGGKEGADPS